MGLVYDARMAKHRNLEAPKTKKKHVGVQNTFFFFGFVLMVGWNCNQNNGGETMVCLDGSLKL